MVHFIYVTFWHLCLSTPGRFLLERAPTFAEYLVLLNFGLAFGLELLHWPVPKVSSWTPSIIQKSQGVLPSFSADQTGPVWNWT